MDIFQVFSALIVLTAIFGYVNIRFLKLPSTIGLLLVSMLFTLGLVLLGGRVQGITDFALEIVSAVDFQHLLLDFMLSFLLFAGALHTNFNLLMENRWPVIVFATLGVFVSAMGVGLLFYGLCILVGVELNFITCMVFGALISPTDPVAVLGVMKKANVPKKLEIKVVGESLFNDGIGVIVFLTFLGLAREGMEGFDAGETSWVLLEEVVGGITLGLALGGLVYFLLRSIDHYETEVLITLAMVMGGFALAQMLHVSGPLAMVVAGLFLGTERTKTARSQTTEIYLEKFWELVDVMLNAVLFVLIGLELLLVEFKWVYLWLGLLAIPAILLVRYLSLGAPVRAFRKKLQFLENTSLILTWAGIRGGISVALALSIPEGLGREIILPVTYVVVVFSILVQGITLGPVTKWLLRNSTEAPMPPEEVAPHPGVDQEE